MRIDAHMHMNFRNISPRNIVDYLDKNEFESCWLMTWEETSPGKWYYEHLCIEDVYEAYSLFPTRIVPMYAPDPNGIDATEKLLKWFDRGIKGCAELKVTLNWQSGKVKDLLAAVSDLKLPVVFHMEDNSEELEPLKSDGTLQVMLVQLLESGHFCRLPRKIFDAFAQYLKPVRAWKRERLVFPGYMLDFASLGATLDEYPSVIFIGHGPLFWKHISSQGNKTGASDNVITVQEGLISYYLRNYPNLYADISAPSGYFALKKDPVFARNFLSEFSHKLLFGTDNYFLGHEELLKSLDLPPDVMERIMGLNAQEVLINTEPAQKLVS